MDPERKIKSSIAASFSKSCAKIQALGFIDTKALREHMQKKSPFFHGECARKQNQCAFLQYTKMRHPFCRRTVVQLILNGIKGCADITCYGMCGHHMCQKAQHRAV